MKLKSIAALLLLSAVPAMAAAVISLPGNTKTSTWTNLNSTQYNATSTNPYPVATSTAAWVPILDDAGSGSSISFTKTSGPGYFISSGAGIYGFHTAGSVYTIAETNPIDNLATLVFQGQFNLQNVVVTFSYNNGNQNLAADFTNSAAVTSAISDFAWQWDLSAITDEISSYTLTINAASSTFIYSASPLSVNTSDSFVQVVPEPTTSLIGAASLGLLALRRRRA